jgi:DNA-binding GntR family transcriptional regulator
VQAQWVRVYDYLRNAIAIGELAPGAQLPPEFEVSASQGVSRNTVRRAYLALSQDGLIRSVNGRGSFVMQTGMTYEIDATSRFRDVLDRQGVQSSMRIIASASIEANAEIAAILGVAPGHKLLRVMALILGDECPFILTVRHIRADLVDDLDAKLKAVGSLTIVAQNEGLGQLHRLSTTVGSRLPTEFEAQHLQCPANAPVLTMLSANAVSNDLLLECQHAVMNSQLLRLSFRSPS